MNSIKELIKERVKKETQYLLKTKQTIRDIAKIFNISKSTVHKDLHERLKEIDLNNYFIVKEIMQLHIDTRHIKGGEATKRKFLKVTEK